MFNAKQIKILSEVMAKLEAEHPSGRVRWSGPFGDGLTVTYILPVEFYAAGDPQGAGIGAKDILSRGMKDARNIGVHVAGSLGPSDV